MTKTFVRLGVISIFFSLLLVQCKQNKIHILVFSKTEGFRHESIEAGKAALEKMAKEKGFEVSFTENAEDFAEANLKNYQAVLFLNTTGDVLNRKQEEAFERFIQAGGGYVGVHAATDTEYDWYWYGRLAGAYFLDHPSDPNVQEGTMKVEQKDHFLTKGMPDQFQKVDEFYSFKSISPKINVVLTIDESTYTEGKNGDFHPMSWYQEYDGGRSFYTAMGHTNETFSEPLFLNHLWEGIKYAAGGEHPKPLDYSKSRPEENRFTKVVLAENLDEPIELTLLDENRVLFIQRKGEVRLYNIGTKELKTIATIPVSTKYYHKDGTPKNESAEDGLMGLNKDPHFAENGWIYMYYSPVNGDKNVLSRFTLKGDELLMDSEIVMLEVATQREECCHTGGSIAWDAEGNLYLSTGDNTNPHASDGYSPSDERPGRGPWDAQKSSANTNDLRGKIIRIKPQPDGTYTIPEGNLFPKGTPKTRPEIYTMGHRNPYRISVDPKTGYVYWGEVGPDAREAAEDRGPAGHDEVGQARKAGNFGWPHFVGNNKAYYKYDFAKEQSLEKWDATKPINTSPNNTGMQELPPAQNAFIWYPYAESEEFPLMGSGGRNAMAGPVFYAEDFKGASHALPKYYDGKLFIYEWMRGFIATVTMDEEGNFESMEHFMPSYKFSNPMDMVFAANGDLYMLEYGQGWFVQNEDARLIRIEYNGGNRNPMAQLEYDKKGGATPLAVNLSAAKSEDPDGDPLSYQWLITSGNDFRQTVETADASLNLTKEGIYDVLLTVDDGKGGKVEERLQLIAGNTAPVVNITLPNKTFYNANQTFDYEVSVSDEEDGNLGNDIAANQVAFTIDYLAEGFDKNIIAMGHRSADAQMLVAKGRKLINDSDCFACHKVDAKSIGPSYEDVGKKYKGDKEAIRVLADRIINGGSGVWGQTPMAAHPKISKEDATEMVNYILSLADKKQETSLPVKGSYTTKLPEGDKGSGVFIIRAAYDDRGANQLPSLSAEETLVLRNTSVGPHDFDVYEKARKMSFGGNKFAIIEGGGAYVVLEKIDLTNIQAVVALGNAPKPRLNAQGCHIELHLDSPTGPLLGKSEFLNPSEAMNFSMGQLTVPVQLPSGYDGQLHDVFMTFVNENAGGNSLMILMGTQFVLNASDGKLR
ncbi:MAG: ThuA domain-containing protein [Bacteroidia bacterium]